MRINGPPCFPLQWRFYDCRIRSPPREVMPVIGNARPTIGYSSSKPMLTHEQLFQRLQTATEITGLIGQTETLHLDCKGRPQSDSDLKKVVAKAMCGFANAEGGVIILGLDARGTSKDDPDIIQTSVPLPDILATRSRLESLVGELVEPRVQGVTVADVPETPGAKTGFVLVNVPPSDGLPCRSRQDWKFYQRISSGTYPMEFYQIARHVR